MDVSKQKTILFCPLHWGWGHITRDLPLIKAFHVKGHHVIVAASPTLIKWLKTEIPQIETTHFEGPDIRYGTRRFSFFKFFIQLPKLLGWPEKEKKRTIELVKEYCPDLIISDNRYGVRHQEIFSVLITHQLMIKLPMLLKWLEYPLHLFIKSLIKKFDECWIPDFSKENSLAGDLVHKYPLPANARLIGPLSRFDQKDNATFSSSRETSPDSILGIISGPEPQRTIFEKKLKKILTDFNGQATIISGKIGSLPNKNETKSSINYLGHLPTNEMYSIIKSHRCIIARSGYSTLMDMYFLNKNFFMVPTPGQTEQEYLAGYNTSRGNTKISQAKLQNSFFESYSKLTPYRQKKSGKEDFRLILKNFLLPT